MIKILLATSLLFVLASCGMSDTPTPPVTDTTPIQTTTMAKNYETTLETASSKIK